MPLNREAIFPSSDYDFITFPSRRSVVHSTRGIVSCTQPLASECGLRILRAGGNAADAAVAVAAGLNVTEPSSTGIGGDMFALYYAADLKTVRGINGSGRSGKDATLSTIRKDLGLKEGDIGAIPMTSVHSVTVPGAPAGWIDVVEKFGSGKVSLEDILAPAIELAAEGFPVSELMSKFWSTDEKKIRDASPNGGEILKDDKTSKTGNRAPKAGELFKNQHLAAVLRRLAKHGKAGFYEGPVAEAIIKVVQDLGGHLTLDDLREHGKIGSQEVEPISVAFNGQDISKIQSQYMDGQDEKSSTGNGVKVWECPPNGQGIVALMALSILEELERTEKIRRFTAKDHNSSEYLHAIIESLRIAFSDAAWFVTDPDVVKVPSKEMLAPGYIAERAKLFDPHKASDVLEHGSPALNHCDTVYFAVTDREGNGCSFINSIYGGFGSAIVPKGTGFPLQNRGAGFSLFENHPNVLAPNKRPYHTIIPAMVTNQNDNSLHSVFGVMGGFMQPQGHVQVLLNMLAFKFNPQSALDAPRLCLGAGTPEQGKVLDRTVYLEEGISDETVEGLKKLGHSVEVVKSWQRGLFGRGQIIRCHVEDGTIVYSAGSDPRGDGAAVPA